MTPLAPIITADSASLDKEIIAYGRCRSIYAGEGYAPDEIDELLKNHAGAPANVLASKKAWADALQNGNQPAPIATPAPIPDVIQPPAPEPIKVPAPAPVAAPATSPAPAASQAATGAAGATAADEWPPETPAAQASGLPVPAAPPPPRGGRRNTTPTESAALQSPPKE